MQGTKTIGKPGKSEGYKIPEGWQLWEYRRGGLPGSNNLVGYPGASGSSIFEFQNDNLGAYEPGDIQVWLLQNYVTESSRSWTAAGASPRLHASYFAGSQWNPGVDVQDEDAAAESVTCDAADQIRSSVKLPKVYYTSYRANGINPLLVVRLEMRDGPGSRNLCYRNGRIYCRVLFNQEHFIQIKSSAAHCTRIG